jgi:D-inositol-3-phosphate glycosyltransferase
MKIAMVSEHASPLAALGGADAGGQNVHVDALARALARRGHEVDVHTRRDDAALPDTVPLEAGVAVRHVAAGPPVPLPKDDLLPHMADFAARLREEWLLDPPDVVHAHFWMSAFAALRATEDLDVPVAVTFHALGSVKQRHQGAADTSPAGRVAAEARIARDCARVVATATEEVDELVALGAEAGDVVVVPCGVDVDHFRPDGELARGMWPQPPTGEWRYRLLSLGRMVPRKGVDDIVRALAAVPDASLVIAGGPAREHLDDDAEHARLLALARSAGVADRVSFVGRVSRAEAPALIRSADVVVCAPWYEPFGIVPLEAMACGRPVVGTAVGGLRDTVVDGETGVLVAPQEPDALAAALRELLPDPDRREAMGRHAADRARRRYSWPSIAAATEQVYAELLAGDPTAAPRGGAVLQEAL